MTTDWSCVALGDVADVVEGTYLAKDRYASGSFLVHGAGSVMGRHDKASDGCESAVSIFGKVGTIGSVRWAPQGAWVNNNAMAARAKLGRIDPFFLHLCLQRLNWDAVSAGTAQKFVKKTSMLRVALNIPPLSEQRRVAQLVSAADAAIDSQATVVARQVAVRDELIESALYPDGSPTQHETSISALATLNPSVIRDDGESFRYISLSDVKPDRDIAWDKLPRLTVGNAPSRARLRVRRNDVLVATVGAHQKGFALIPEQRGRLVASTGFAVLRPREGVDPRTIWAVVRGRAFLSHLSRHTRGTTLPSVRPKEVLAYSAPRLPLPAELDAIEAADLSLAAAQARLRASADLRGQLLHDLLSGSHRIPESYDELERPL